MLVPYPRGAQTGGPEALHQLVDSLRRLGVDAWLWATPETRGSERVPDYARYDAPETTEKMDEADTAVVLSETMLGLTSNWRRARIFCWWLSIDKCPYFGVLRRCQNARLDGVEHAPFLLAKAVLGAQRRALPDRLRLARMTHLSQSRFAHDFIRRTLWVSPTMLGDYIPAGGRSTGRKPSTLSIAYNPTKGLQLTEEIRSLTDSSIEWLPIAGLTREGVDAMLDRATVYLETGEQPGKDRIPREAALRGCVVIMLRKGAGRSRADCPLPEEHVIEPGPGAAERFVTALTRVAADVEHHRSQQQPYLDMVLRDQAAFERAVEGIFVKGERGIRNWYASPTRPFA